MKISDTRSLPREAQQQNRFLAIKLRKEGMTFIKISKIIGVARQTVGKWWKIYKKEGLEALILKKRGPKSGTKGNLSFEQIENLKQNLIYKTPDQLELFFSLWTRRAIKIFIKKSYKISVSFRTVGRYMKKLGFTPQRPIKVAYQKNPDLIQKWLNKDYPEIAKKAKREKAEIHWVDETGIRSDQHHGRSYSPKGKTPLIQIDARRVKVNLISSVTNRGQVRFMTYTDKMNAKNLIEFARRLIKNKKNKIFVILDNLRVHHCKKFKKWLKTRENKIEVFYLPSYSPELNPDEKLNRDLKSNFYYGYTSQNKETFRKKVTSFLRYLQRNPLRVIGYFKNDLLKYAA